MQKGDKFVQIGVTTVRNFNDTDFVDVPLYVQVSELKNNGLSESEENLLKKVSSALMRIYERKIVQYITETQKERVSYGTN